MNILSRQMPIAIGIFAIIHVISVTIYLTGRDGFADDAVSLVADDIGKTNTLTRTNTSMDMESHIESSKMSEHSSSPLTQIIVHEPEPLQEHTTTTTTTTTNNDVKIVAFTDGDYAVAAEWWYQRMTNLTYDTHTLILIDSAAEEYFDRMNSRSRIMEPETGGKVEATAKNQRYRTETWLIHPVGKGRQDKTASLWYRRIEYCLEQLKKGQSLLLTDVDNIFRKYVPLSEFQDSSYDAMYSMAQKFPKAYFQKQGFVLCGCLTFLKATDETIAMMEQLLDNCKRVKRCDDQVEMNKLLHSTMDWDVDIHTAKKSSRELLQDGFGGISTETGKGFQAKVWDRDFAWRGDFEESCPPVENNWVAMPGSVPWWIRKPLTKKWPVIGGSHGGGYEKIARMKIWENHCGENGTYFASEITSPTDNVTATMESAFQRFRAVELG